MSCISSATDKIYGLLMNLWIVSFAWDSRVVSEILSSSWLALICCMAEKNTWSIPFFVKYSFHILIFYGLTRSLLLTTTSDLFLGSTSFTYYSKSSLLKNKMSLPSTIWMIMSALSTTLHNCLQTSMFFSYGVICISVFFSSICANVLRQFKYASAYFFSNCYL